MIADREQRDRDLDRTPSTSGAVFWKLSYSEVAKKNAGSKETLSHPGYESMSGEEAQSPDNVTIGRVHADLKLTNVKHRRESPEEATMQQFLEPQDRETHEGIGTEEEIVVEANLCLEAARADDNANSPREPQGSLRRGKSREKAPTIASSSGFPGTIRIEEPPEPMDTSEEPLSPTESILTRDPAQGRKKHEIKSYAEAIGESESWEERELSTLQNLSKQRSPDPSSTSNSFIISEAREYGDKPHNQMILMTEAARKVSQRLTNLPKAKETSYLSNILHVASLEDVETGKPAEERASEVRKELAHLRNAVEEENVVVVEESLITIIETISTWLETIEYRIFLGRESPSGPSHNDSRTFIDLRDEVNHVEQSIKELDIIWNDIESKYPEDERSRVCECMEALEHQVKAIDDVTSDGERYTNAELARWDEFINGVSNIYR